MCVCIYIQATRRCCFTNTQTSMKHLPAAMQDMLWLVLALAPTALVCSHLATAAASGVVPSPPVSAFRFLWLYCSMSCDSCWSTGGCCAPFELTSCEALPAGAFGCGGCYEPTYGIRPQPSGSAGT